MSRQLDSSECIWMTAGIVSYKLCDRDFNCEDCPFDQAIRGEPGISMSQEREQCGKPGRGQRLFLVGSQKSTRWKERINFSPELFYDRTHEWARVEEGGKVRVGLDDFAQRLMGPVYSVSLPAVGTPVKKLEKVWEVIHHLGPMDLTVPVEGTVCWVNERLLQTPSLINRDPFGDGAVLAVEPSRLVRDLKDLFYGQKARDWLEDEISILGARVDQLLSGSRPPVGSTFSDGGSLCGDLFYIVRHEEILHSLPAAFLRPGGQKIGNQE